MKLIGKKQRLLPGDGMAAFFKSESSDFFKLSSPPLVGESSVFCYQINLKNLLSETLYTPSCNGVFPSLPSHTAVQPVMN